MPLLCEHSITPGPPKISMEVSHPECVLISQTSFFAAELTSQHFTMPLLSPLHSLLMDSCFSAFTSVRMCGFSCVHNAGVSKLQPSMLTFEMASMSLETVPTRCGVASRFSGLGQRLSERTPRWCRKTICDMSSNMPEFGICISSVSGRPFSPSGPSSRNAKSEAPFERFATSMAPALPSASPSAIAAAPSASLIMLRLFFFGSLNGVFLRFHTRRDSPGSGFMPADCAVSMPKGEIAAISFTKPPTWISPTSRGGGRTLPGSPLDSSQQRTLDSCQLPEYSRRLSHGGAPKQSKSMQVTPLVFLACAGQGPTAWPSRSRQPPVSLSLASVRALYASETALKTTSSPPLSGWCSRQRQW
mmetsp:Transcript_102263/g.329724  ORF Transcript_102263/g.329724 Transcript_102263/m.329724 type:complete len:359 (-) Transcript_102263:908-1984(-)